MSTAHVSERSRLFRHPRRHRAILYSCLVLVYLVWGTTYPAIRLMVTPAHGQGLPTFFAAGSRLLLAGFILCCAGVANGSGRAAIRRMEGYRLRAAIRAGLLLSFGTGILQTFAAQKIESGILATIMATAPLWTAVLVAASTRHFPRPATLAGLGLGLGGVTLLANGSTFTLDRTFLLAIAAALTWSVGSWYTSRTTLPVQIWLAAGIGQLVSGLALLLVATAAGEVQALAAEPASQASWMALAYLTCVSMTGLTAYSWLLVNAYPVVATTHAFVNPVVAAFIGPLVLPEQLQAIVLISAGLVGLGAFFVLSADRPSVRRRLGRAAFPSPPEG